MREERKREGLVFLSTCFFLLEFRNLKKIPTLSLVNVCKNWLHMCGGNFSLFFFLSTFFSRLFGSLLVSVTRTTKRHQKPEKSWLSDVLVVIFSLSLFLMWASRKKRKYSELSFFSEKDIHRVCCWCCCGNKMRWLVRTCVQKLLLSCAHKYIGIMWLSAVPPNNTGLYIFFLRSGYPPYFFANDFSSKIFFSSCYYYYSYAISRQVLCGESGVWRTCFPTKKISTWSFLSSSSSVFVSYSGAFVVCVPKFLW